MEKACIVPVLVNNDIKCGAIYEKPVDFLHDARALSCNAAHVAEPINEEK